MTIICALKDEHTGSVWMGADSQVSSKQSDFIWPESAKKILRCGKWSIGVSGQAIANQIIREKSSIISGLVSVISIANFLYQEFKERDFKRDEQIGCPGYGFRFIVCDRSNIWEIADGGYVAEADRGFIAIGSGDELAYGAWHALRWQSNVEPHEIVRAALEAACAFSSDCGGELVVEKVE